MPNLIDPVDTLEKAMAYRNRIKEARSDYFMNRVPFISNGENEFTPCMTLYLTDHTQPQDVVEAYERGIIRAVKLYIADQNGQGGTTGSHGAVRNLKGRYSIFEMMEKHQIPLLGHFEAAEEEVDEFDREAVSVRRDLSPILTAFPGLPVVFEHLTTGDAADFVAEYNHPGGLFATVTAQHLMYNRSALFWVKGKGRGLNPIHYCLPILKREADRVRVCAHVTSGNPRFGAGTDSAPHDESAKMRCCGCSAGDFTAPVAVEMYTTIFDGYGALQHLGPFLSENFLHLYGMEVSKGMMIIERTPLIIPEKIGNVRVLNGGGELPWKLVS